MPEAEQVLETARQELGYQESPPESNRTKYGKWYGLDGQPWCMMFVMWVFGQTGALALLPTRTASCGEFVQAAKKAGNWRTADFAPGDVVVFNFPHTGVVTDHAGIVEQVEENCLVTIEGNTGSSSDNNGGTVMRRQRPLSVVLGGFRPAYGAEELAPIPEDAVPGEPGETGDAARPETEEPVEPDTELLTLTASLPVRCGPGKEYVALGVLPEGAEVSIDRNWNGWGRLRDGGWIDLQNTKQTG